MKGKMEYCNTLLFLGYFLIAFWTTGFLYKTEAAFPAGYLVESAFGNFYRATNRAVNQSEANYIFANASTCKCRNICFSVIGCQAWSITVLANGTQECRVTKRGPANGTLLKDNNSTYFFFQGNICEYSSSTVNKVLPYDMDIVRDLALQQPTTSSTPYANLMPSYLGNDGNDTTWFASDTAAFTWWSVDLLINTTIFYVKILPRQTQSIRFKNIELYIGDTPPTAGDVSKQRYLGVFTGPYNNTLAWLVYTCHGVTGRYLTLKSQTSADYVDMMTFQAFAIVN